MGTLADEYDCLMLDLDGTVFRGHQPTEGAVDALDRAAGRTLFITNNASRTAAEVAAHLRELGFHAADADVVTSAQTAARLLATRLPPGSPVLIVGTDSLAAEITEVGLRPVRRFEDDPVAVVQGHSPTTGWPQLAEAALAVRAGAHWLATNVDRTLPSERGLLPGNGAMVAALRAATDTEPDVAGKPAPPLMKDALKRGEFTTPLVVGDRLDTDIAGANNTGLPSLMVLTGVNTARDAVHAIPGERPTYLAADLRCLHRASSDLAIAAHPAWRIAVEDTVVTVTAADSDAEDPDPLAVVRAVARAVWDAGLDAGTATIAAGDAAAHDALQRWSLLNDPDRLA
ncbi:HAD-IIA family hydrolase [Mycobacterium sp. 1274756.6]|uniref:HAD-IIA family hydrolase n=1 Tax=Mycobacterium sp. 1274756.6 TaxID=1834076 RepID=UPI000800C2FA|nr:HAD-IIA family hydrolase [Mycobacterium sp. 1274756.6]OBJ72602.1 HAD family hydrolase [Mycobacterium sp. 1274756.6]